MQAGNAERLAPLTGIVFVAIVVIAFSIGGDTPGVHDAAAKVQAFYAKHHSTQQAAAIVLVFSAPFLVWFASDLRNALQAAGGTGRLANAAFAGAVIAAGGFLVAAGVHFALADAAANAKSIGAVPALSALDADLFFPFGIGVGILVLSAGLSAVRHGGLPKWLAWVGVVVGVVSFTPAGFVAFMLSGVWIIAASVVLFRAPQAAPAQP